MKSIFIITTILLSSISLNSQILDISTPSGWTPVGFTTNVTPFYGHSNWINIVSATSNTTYKFTKTFHVCKEGKYHFTFSGYGDNQLTVKLSGGTILFTHPEITTASEFNTPKTGTFDITLKCGEYVMEASLMNRASTSGFFLNANISGEKGGLSDQNCQCILPIVCRCPKIGM